MASLGFRECDIAVPVAVEAAREHSQGEQPLRVSAHLASCGKRGALAGDLVVTRGQQEGVNFTGICLQGDAGDLPGQPHFLHFTTQAWGSPESTLLGRLLPGSFSQG